MFLRIARSAKKREMKFRAPLRSFASEQSPSQEANIFSMEQAPSNAAARICFAVCATENQTGASVMKKVSK